MNDELVVVKKVDIPALFEKDGSNPIIEGLKREAAKFKGDASTVKGRKEIGSFSRKFSTAGVYLDGLGKDLSDELRAKIAPINTERNKIKACCNELRDSSRKPLTDWEEIDKKRVADIEERIRLMEASLDLEFVDAENVKVVLDKVKVIVIDNSFEEYDGAAAKVKDRVVTHLEAKFIVLQNQEKEKAEAESLEKERLAKEQEDREKKIAEDAAEKAKLEAEEKAQKEQEEKDRLAKEAVEKAERETLEAKLETKLETERAEREKLEASEKAEQEKKESVEAEKQRQADEKQKEKESEEKRQANKRHRTKINNQAKSSLVNEGFDDNVSEKIVIAIAKGLIKNVTINY